MFWAPDEADDITDRIVAANTGNSDTPLRQWIFEGRTDNPLIRTSQYVSISMADMEGNDTRYRPVIFSIETHVRIATDASQIFIPSERRRRSSTDLDEILTEIEAIEQQATDFILNGDMVLPDNVEVAATGLIETIEFVQTSNDGSVAADCSSGTCKCSPGFIDNGNGCEEMTEEQAATTTVQSSSAGDWPVILVDKLTAVFADNRPDKLRTELLKKWQKLGRKFVKRYETVAANDCQFAENYEDDSVDFDSINTCRVSFSSSNLINLFRARSFDKSIIQDINQVEESFSNWGQQFTYDCNKEKRRIPSHHYYNSFPTHTRWFDRKIKHVAKIADLTRSKLNCKDDA